MSVDWRTFVLPERSALDPAQGLAAFLKSSRGCPVRIQAQAMTVADTRLLQYLMAASRAWKDQSIDFVVTGVGPRLDAEFAWIGLTADHLTWQGELA